MRILVQLLLLSSVIFCLQLQANTLKSSHLENVFIDVKIPSKYLLEEGINAQIDYTFHLFSHGKPGELLINGKWLNAQEIVVFLQQQNFSSEIKNLNIYGCEFAKGVKGLAAVQYIEKATGLQVAASTNITGKEGDWILEIGNRQIEGLESYGYNLQCANQGIGLEDDYDCDGVLNKDDDDDDNDGISDLLECDLPFAEGIVANGNTFDWGGNTTSSVSVNTTANVNEDRVIYANFIDSDGIRRNLISPHRWDKYDQVTFTITFSPAVPANEISFLIEDVNEEQSGYYTFSVTGPGGANDATRSDFSLLQNGNRFLLNYDNTTGVILRRDTGSTTDNNNPQDGILAGNSTALVSSMTIDGSNLIDGANDWVAYGLFARVDCQDTDQDGVLDIYDLDSDGDGCPDAIEGGANFNATDHLSTNTNMDGGNTGNDYTGTAGSIQQNLGTNSNSAGVPTFGNQTVGGSQTYSTQTDCCLDPGSYTYITDTDGDSVADGCDVDDDNDGILDEDEECLVQGGLRYEYYDSSPADFTVDNIPKTGALGTGIASDFDLSAIQETHDPGDTEYYSIRYNGYIDIPQTGEYTFYVRSDDGSKLFIGENEVVDNDGAHSLIEKNGTINLAAGIYRMTLLYFQAAIHTHLFVEYQLPGTTTRIDVPFSSFLYGEECDMDNDGLVNRLDLDSDGDACPDLVEGGVPLTNTEVEPAMVTNLDSTTSTNVTVTIVNAQLDTGAADANTNGLNDSVEEDTTATVATVNYTSTYINNAMNIAVSSCLYDVSLGKKVNNAIIKLGNQVVYTLTVRNESEYKVTGIAVTDVLPEGVTYVSDDSSGGFVNSTGIWTIGDMDPNETKILNIVVTVNQVGNITNTAEITQMNETDKDSIPNNGQ